MKLVGKANHHCPKCGSEEILDYSTIDPGSANSTPMFCQDCHAIGSKAAFDKPPPPWKWRYWRIKLIPLVIGVGVSLVLPFHTAPRVIIGTVLYLFLFCITWRRANGDRVFPPYLW